MKNRMTTILITTLLATLMISFPALAAPGQGNGGDFGGRNGPPSAEAQLARMSDALNLTEEQSMQMLEVLLDAEARRMAQREEVNAIIAPEYCANRAATEADIEAILTPEQVATFEEMKAKRADRAKERQGRRGKQIDCSAYEGES